MHRKLVERGRAGWRVRQRAGRRRARLRPEEAPSWEPIRRSDHRHQTENFAPLVRYLRKQAGRPWNLVFSEICKVIRSDGVIQKHLHDHLLQDLVALHVRIVDGTPCVWRWRDWVAVDGRGFAVWVCPRTGLVRRSSRKRGRHANRIERRP